MMKNKLKVLFRRKNGQSELSLQNLGVVVLTLGTAALIFGTMLFAAESLADTARVTLDNATPNSSTPDYLQLYQPLNASVVAFGTFGTTWMSPIVSVVAAGILIGIVVGAFAFIRR